MRSDRAFARSLLIASLLASVASRGTDAKAADPLHPKLRRASKPANSKAPVEDSEYWLNLGQMELERMLKQAENINTNVAKNVIIFIGDGMSLPTVYAAGIYKAQHEARQQDPPPDHVDSEGSRLTFETFPHAALIKTFSVDQQIADSSCSASAIFSGVKTNYDTLGFDSSIEPYSAESQQQATRVETIMKWAQDAGKDTGFVTTARVTHATPAALYAHLADREWECDSAMSEEARSVEGALDATVQLVTTDPGRRAKVVFGGGLLSWLPDNETEATFRTDYDDPNWDCVRLDGRNLVEEFLNKSGNVPGFEGAVGKVVYDRDEMLQLDPDEFDYVLGLFSMSFMEYEYKRNETTNQPSLPEMTRKAIEILSKNEENGFFLMVEGSNIDHGHHTAKAREALMETMMMDKAVEVALSMVNASETLIIVTADHGHTFTTSGYSSRGSDIRGLADFQMGDDDLPFTIMSYANGKGFYNHFKVAPNEKEVVREDLTGLDVSDFTYRFTAPVPTSSETHSGADVGIFALGPFAHLFQSVHDQSFIAQVMSYSACIGPHRSDTHCTGKDKNNGANGAPALSILTIVVSSLFALISNR